MLRLVTPGFLQYTPLSLNIIIIIIHSMAFKMSALYTLVTFSRSQPIFITSETPSFVFHTHTFFYTIIFLIFLLMWSSHNYSIPYYLLIHFDLNSPFRSVSLNFRVPIHFIRHESRYLPLSIPIVEPFNLQIHRLNHDIPILSLIIHQ